MQLTGAEIILECLKEQGVDTIFGYPGGTILNVYDALYKYKDQFRHILTSHEQGAAHAADGYARATGKVGVCMATSGPGATNLVTGIATAYMDSVPVVAITANVGVSSLGKDSFQEVDIAGVTMPVTKHNFIVKDIRILAKTIRRAFQIAKSGRPGPVLVDVTKDVTALSTEFEPQKPEPILPYTDQITEESLTKAAEMINQAEKPYVLVGGGAVISGAYEQVRSLVRKIQAPVADTLMGKGVFPGTDELYTGMLGMHGTKTANYGVSQCDLLIVLGARFSDRVVGNPKRFADKAKILQLDIDAAEVNKTIPVDACVIGDLKEILLRLEGLVAEQDHGEWLAHIRELKERYPLKYDRSALTGPAVIEAVYEATGGDAVITTDVGQHQMWTAQYYRFKEPRTFLTSGGLGTMGYGLGACIGAKCGRPDKTVINIGGDGCFRMNMNELATASRYDIPIIQIVVNNKVLGMVRQWQTLFYGRRYSATVLDDKVDFVKVSEGLGVPAVCVKTKEELMPAIRRALDAKGPFMIEVQIDCDDKVFPMVAAGAPIEEVFDGDDLEKN